MEKNFQHQSMQIIPHDKLLYLYSYENYQRMYIQVPIHDQLHFKGIYVRLYQRVISLVTKQIFLLKGGKLIWSSYKFNIRMNILNTQLVFRENFIILIRKIFKLLF